MRCMPLLKAVEAVAEVVNGVRCVLGVMLCILFFVLLCMLLCILEVAEGELRLLEVLE